MVSISLVLTIAVITAAFFALVIGVFLRARRKQIVTGQEALVGAEGETVFWDNDQGRVRIQGEIWRARAGSPLSSGVRIKVIGRDGLMLIVEPA